jgi:regulator of protease activity HflC (stomatin/prohibitin superfamily)
MPFLDIIAVGLVLIALSGLRVAQEYERGVVFRLGRYKGLRGPGLYWIIPLNIERSVRVDIRTRTVSAEQQETITRDSVTIKVNAVLWYRIVDASKAVIAVASRGGVSAGADRSAQHHRPARPGRDPAGAQ